MLARPGVDKGRQVPTKDGMQELKNNPELMKQKEEEAKAWIQKGMKDDAAKK